MRLFPIYYYVIYTLFNPIKDYKNYNFYLNKAERYKRKVKNNLCMCVTL